MDQEKRLLRPRHSSYDYEAHRHDLHDHEDDRHDNSTPMRVSRKMMRAFSRGPWLRGSSPLRSANGRAVVARKYLVLLFFILAIIFVTHRSGRSIYHAQSSEYHAQTPGSESASGSSASSGKSTSFFHPTPKCATNETYDIRAPVAADKTYLNALWNSLSKNFDVNAPTPTHVDHPMKGDPPTGGKKTGTLFPFTEEDAEDSRAAHAAVIRELPDYPAGTFHGRGVVVLAGGRYSEYAATSLGVLRAMGSKLPVEVWMADPTEETPHWCEELERDGMSCRRLTDYMDIDQLKHPYAWKVFTLLYSSFKEVLFMDADSMPMKNPDYLFDCAPYLKTGAVLWPDYWNNTGSPWTPYVTGQLSQPSDDWQDLKSVESGQIMWNKEKHWKSLLLASYYNYWGPDFYYTLINNGYAGWGDKDTFPIAMQALKEEYHMVPTGLGTAFIQGTVHGIAMLQADPRVTDKLAPQFMHSNIVKWAARKFWCDDSCRTIGTYKIMPSHAVNTGSSINQHLHSNLRIFPKKDMAGFGLDPEPYMWRSMERAACRSLAWGEPDVCNRIRGYMSQTFGASFVSLGPEQGMGPGNQMCLEMPADPL